MKYDTTHIDQYLNGELSESEVKIFEEKMRADKDFAYEVKLQDAAIQVIQYPNFMNEMKNVRDEIAAEEETPVVQKKHKRFSIIRRLLPIAAMLLLIPSFYFLWPSSNPIAATTTQIINFESGTKGDAAKTPLQQGINLFNDKNYQAAIPFFDQVIRETPNKRADAQFLKADALHRLDRKEEAKAVLQSIEQSDDEQFYNKAQSILEKYK